MMEYAHRGTPGAQSSFRLRNAASPTSARKRPRTRAQRSCTKGSTSPWRMTVSPGAIPNVSSDRVPPREPTTLGASPVAVPADANDHPIWLQEGKKSGGHFASRLLIQKVS